MNAAAAPPPESGRSGGDAPAAFIVRQPMLDADHRIAGYELLLETDARGAAGAGQSAAARDALLLGMCAAPEIGQLGEQLLTLISLSADSLHHPFIDYLPAGNMVIAVAVPESVPPRLLGDLKALAAKGFHIALDGVQHSAQTAPLLEVADYARLDVGRATGMQVSRRASELMERAHVRLIAGNLQCAEEFALCRGMPFEYYEGYYFSLNQYRNEVPVDQNRSTVIELLNLARTDAELRALEAVFRRDPLLTYQLLRYINSPGSGMLHEIRSIAHALMVLGRDQLYRWLTLLLFSRTGAREHASAYMTNALVRGKLAESLGHDRLAPAQRDSLFVVGVFSLLDALLGVPLARALEGLRLTAEMEAALLQRQGPLAPFLELALACERRRPLDIAAVATACGLDPAAVNTAHVNALVWADAVVA